MTRDSRGVGLTPVQGKIGYDGQGSIQLLVRKGQRRRQGIRGNVVVLPTVADPDKWGALR